MAGVDAFYVLYLLLLRHVDAHRGWNSVKHPSAENMSDAACPAGYTLMEELEPKGKGTYCLGSLIGAGGFGSVVECIRVEDNARLAVKFPAVKSECDVLKKFKDKHIMGVEDCGYNKLKTSFYIVMERIDGVTLTQRMSDSKLDLDYFITRHNLARQLVAAVQLLHSRGVAHLDIKPDNILVTKDDTVKLVDFGLAYDSARGIHHLVDRRLGTPLYKAPELWTRNSSDPDTLEQDDPFAADVWSLGATLFELFTSRSYLDFAGARTPIYYFTNYHDKIRAKEKYGGHRKGRAAWKVLSRHFSAVTHALKDQRHKFMLNMMPHGLIKILDKMLRTRPKHRASMSMVSSYFSDEPKKHKEHKIVL
eukprot:TRINITY_DN24326_c0_g1_i1.p1 TRINITY_DN24326_c0_g1~~TRINITY_DN24326_c0_g1_i1.p1  ORF type:complete len:378 (-),score=31.86 TRINITY_DN24326_c0_g1_i1:138-1226(-)